MKFVYLLALLAGAALATYGVFDTLLRLGTEPSAISFERGGAGLALLVYSALHGYHFARRRWGYVALAIYVVFYPVIAVIYSNLLRSMMKGFVPDQATSVDHVVTVLILSVAIIFPIFLLSRTQIVTVPRD